MRARASRRIWRSGRPDSAAHSGIRARGSMTTTTVMRKQLFIDGQWRDAASGRTLDVVNPATEETIATVASAERGDVDAAVAAARAALSGPWGKLSARDRGRLIWKIGEKLMEKADEL